MRCASALSTSRSTGTAFREVREKLQDGMGGAQADLILLFASTHHADELRSLAASLMDQGATRHVLGCTGESIAGEDQEIEGAAALAAWSITLPGAFLRPLRLEVPGETPLEWTRGIEDPERSAVLLLGDPFSFQPDPFLNSLHQAARGLRVIGGMASAGQVPRANQLVLDGHAFHDGAVAVLLTGALSIQTVVSQGCRPIGRPLVVTRAERNSIRELGRRPALEVLRELFQGLSAEDRRRVQEDLHVGRVINEYQETFQRGDFLVRNVIGADDSGAIQINDLIRVGQTIQFHVRDAETAHEDLRESLLAARDQSAAGPPAGALLFTCNGRGTRMFNQPAHDVGLIREVLGPIPVAGFFAMGELGPIGGQNFVHGFTASIALFRPGA